MLRAQGLRSDAPNEEIKTAMCPAVDIARNAFDLSVLSEASVDDASALPHADLRQSDDFVWREVARQIDIDRAERGLDVVRTPLMESDSLPGPKSDRPRAHCLDIIHSEDRLRASRHFLTQRTTIGRSSKCSIVIDCDSVSRTHCLIETTPDSITLIDSSTNGVLVNGKRVNRAQVRLKHHDRVQISRTVFEVLTPTESIGVFISYGGPDVRFANLLHKALEAEGFRVFFFPKTAQARYMGEHIAHVTRTEITARDIVVLVCSRSSLDRPGVAAELRHVLSKEEMSGGRNALIPITLDDHVFSWTPTSHADIAGALRSRVIGDFQAVTDRRSFFEAVTRLADSIRRMRRQL